MKTIDIVETIANLIEQQILGEWKHEGFIDHMYSDCVDVLIDGKHYTITVKCMEDKKTQEVTK